MEEVILQLKDVCKSFSSVEVIKKVNLSLKKGKILGLVGENGAGKSTLMNVLGGIHPKSSGEFLLYGRPYTPKNPQDAIDAGIAFIHQEVDLFTNLNVAENIFINEKRKSTYGFISDNELYTNTQKLLDNLNLDVNPRSLVNDLPMGIRQMIEIAKAVAKEAKIIFFDEPTTSLSEIEKETLFRLIREFAGKGISMIYISHAIDDVLNLCDEIQVLRDGSTIGEQTPVSEITKEQVIERMVGRSMSQMFPYIEKNIGDKVLQIENLCKEAEFGNINITVNKGEIVGLFGLMGAGRSEFANAVFGIEKYDSGNIILFGKDIKYYTPHDWIESGVAYITENRRDDGLLMPRTIFENLILVGLDKFKYKGGILNKKRADSECKNIVDQLAIKTHSIRKQIAGTLSGGNQQKTVIGKWLMVTPHILIIDEPTRGVDVGAKFEIYEHINNLVNNGSAVLLISSEMEELMGVCDRIMVMSAGSIVGEFQREEYSQEDILKLAIGGAEVEERNHSNFA